MDAEENLQLTAKQTLILFFIETEFADNEYKLIKHLDRSEFFPSELSMNLQPLLKYRLIEVSGCLNNGTPFKYTITEKGNRYLDQNLKSDELMNFANGYSNKDFMIQIISTLLKRRASKMEFKGPRSSSVSHGRDNEAC
jgi:DNA-binding PadR family transcriptional regulator